MSGIRRFAQRIRHLPGLEGADFLWRALRGPYHRLIEAGGKGVRVVVGGAAAVRIPAEFAGGSWERHEPEAVAAFARWIESHPGALVLDVGSSVGIFSAIALFADSRSQVVAFDSDLSSLAASRRLCRYAQRARLSLVHGFVAAKPTHVCTLAAAASVTEAALAQGRVRGEAGTTRYICLTDKDSGGIPIYRLDDLFAKDLNDARPILIKCDVEGAELLVLRGAEEFLRHAAPAMLISVHPPALPAYGHDKADIEAFLNRLGYEFRVLAVDHEEHWWCEPARAAPLPRID